MNWKKDVIAMLRKYDAWKVSMKNIPRMIRDTERGLVSTPRQEQQRLDCLAFLRENLEQARTNVKLLERGFSTLNPEERLILQHLYICPRRGAMEWLCQALGKEQSSIYRRRNRGLLKLARALYGVTEG